MIAFLIVVLVYMLPTFIAGFRGHPNGIAIAIINIFLGWTFVGWVIALAWASASTAPRLGS